MRSITRAFFAASLSTLAAACSIGEGNGIVGITIIGTSTDDSAFEMRADQCEGLLVGLNATFTDGQTNVYTNRATWSIESGNATLVELQNSAGQTTAVEIIPTTATSVGDSIVVKAEYLELSAIQTITVNDITINSLQVEPAKTALITGETQAVSVLLTLSDGTVIQNPLRALDVSLSDETAFTLNGTNAGGQQLVATTETTGTANLNVEFCARLDGDNAAANTIKRTASATADHFTGSQATLEITEDFNSDGVEAVNSSTTYRLPTDSASVIGARLRFPNGVTRALAASTVTWTATDSEGECNDTNPCPATINAVATTTNTSRGQSTITASFTTADEQELTQDTALVLDIATVNYQTPAFELRNESNQVIDTSQSPALSLTSGTARVLRFIAKLVDDLGTADTQDDVTYELPVNPGFTLADENDNTFITPSSNTLSGTGTESNSNVIINITSTGLPGASENGFTNNIESFGVELHQIAPSDIIIDSDGDLNTAESGTTINLTEGNTLQLNSVLPFAGEDSVLRNGATVWSVDDAGSSVVAVGNLTNAGFITTLGTGTAVITATHTFTDASETVHLSSASITVQVNAAP